MPNFRKSNMFTRQAKIEEQVFGVNNDSEMGFLSFCESTVFTRQQLEAINLYRRFFIPLTSTGAMTQFIQVYIEMTHTMWKFFASPLCSRDNWKLSKIFLPMDYH